MIDKQILPKTYIIQQTGHENIQTYQVKLVILIQHQPFVTNLKGKSL